MLFLCWWQAMSDSQEDKVVLMLPEERKSAEDVMRVAVGATAWGRWLTEERVRVQVLVDRAHDEGRKAGRAEVMGWMGGRMMDVEEPLVKGAWAHVLSAVVSKFNRKRVRR